MIDWLDQDCKAWGRAQYWLMYAKDGYPTRNILDKMAKEGAVIAHTGHFMQHYPEVLTGRNLVIGNAVKRLGEDERALVTVHYVVRLPVKIKCQTLGIGHRTYYTRLNELQWHFANLVDEEANRVAQNCTEPCAQVA